MAYALVTPRIGAQDIAENSTTQRHPLGTCVMAVDPTYGEGEFLYLLGVASTVVGSVVTYNATTWQTALATDDDDLGSPLAIAMSANVASEYGWYQIAGNAVVKKVAVQVDPQVAVYMSATDGRITDVSSTGEQILGARSANLTTVTSTTSTLVVTINRPCRTGV